MVNSLLPRRRERTGNGTDVLAPISRLRWDWDRLFDTFLDDVWSPISSNVASTIPLEMTETDDTVRIRAEVPGVRPDELDVNLSGDVLTLAGEKKDEATAREGARHVTERRYGAFRRAVQLPCPVDPEKVEAVHEHGVVTITLQKAEAVRPKRIRVKAG